MKSVTRISPVPKRSSNNAGNRKRTDLVKPKNSMRNEDDSLDIVTASEKAINPWTEFKGLFKGSAAFVRVQKRMAQARKRRIKLSK